MKNFQEAVQLAEELRIHQDDVFNTLPKIRLAAEALNSDQIEKAGRLIDESLKELRALKTQKPRSIKNRLWFGWLEIFYDIFQKISLMLILGYLLVHIGYFNRMIREQRLTLWARCYLALYLSGAAVLVSFFDLSRYGESAWAFFDIQTILVAAGGLLGGPVTGLLTGGVVAVYRMALNPAFMVYAFSALAAAVISSFLSKSVKNLEISGRRAFFCGALTGLVQALAIYLPLFPQMAWLYFCGTLLVIALLEGFAVLLFTSVILMLIQRQKRENMERDLLKTKLLFLQAQMSPHFLFNALNTISSICGKGEAGKAQQLILRLAEFLRRTLKREDEMVTIEEELHYIDSYLEIEKARYQERLEIVKDFSLNESDWKIKVPLLVLQPIVENAVRHGIGKKESGGRILLQGKIEKENMVLTVSDNGAGMDRSRMNSVLSGEAQSQEGLGIGLYNIHQRLMRLFGCRNGLVLSSVPGEGTRVEIKIPLKRDSPS